MQIMDLGELQKSCREPYFAGVVI